MDFLILCLSTFVFSVLAGFALYAVTCVTAVSELFAPLRGWLKAAGRPKAFDSLRPFVRYQRAIARFFHALVICPFCSSWWHAVWVLPVMHLAAGGSWRLVFLAYLPSIGIRAVIGMLHHQVYERDVDGEPAAAPTVVPRGSSLQTMFQHLMDEHE